MKDDIRTNYQDNDFDPDSMLPDKEVVEPIAVNIGIDEKPIDVESNIKATYALHFADRTYSTFVQAVLLQYRFDSKTKPNYEFVASIKQEDFVDLITCSGISWIALQVSGNNDSGFDERVLRTKYADVLRIDSCQTLKMVNGRYILKFAL